MPVYANLRIHGLKVDLLIKGFDATDIWACGCDLDDADAPKHRAVFPAFSTNFGVSVPERK
jgi:hypothetical protein